MASLRTGTLCSVKDCGNRSSVRNLSFFGYPKEDDRRAIWMKNCRTEHLAGSLLKSNSSFRVCGEHFEDKMFLNPITKSRLIHNAVPTLFNSAECKEKWRNQRTVFTCKMKTPQSGSGRMKKAYYLADAMQFSVPYIKTIVPPSTGNLPEIPRHKIIENAKTYDDNIDSQDESVQSSQLQPPPPPQTSPPLQAPPSMSLERTVLPQQGYRSQERSSSSRIKKNLTLKNKLAMEADICVAEYFKAKKARLETTLSTAISQNSERKEALKMFLLSLIPEVEHFNNDQIKLFKRKIFNVIDDISHQSQPNSISSMPSSQSATSFHTIDSSQSTTSFPSMNSSQSTTTHTSSIASPSSAL